MRDDMAKVFHSINNTVGAIVMNLELITDKKLAEGLCLDAVVAALEQVERLEGQLGELRAMNETAEK